MAYLANSKKRMRPLSPFKRCRKTEVEIWLEIGSGEKAKDKAVPAQVLQGRQVNEADPHAEIAARV
jgi:hypothetical protein